MLLINHGTECREITLEETNNLGAWRKLFFQEEYQKMERFWLLFNSRNISVTWRLLIMGILNSFIGTGTVFLLPFLFDDENRGLWEYFITTVVEVPALVLLYFIIDWEKIGRIHLFNLILVLSMFFNFTLYYKRENFLIMGITGI
jgi:hypothetical protein